MGRKSMWMLLSSISIDPTKVVQIHIQWQDRYEDLIRAQVRGIIRDAVSQYRVEEVVSTKRFDLVTSIRRQFTAQKLKKMV